MEIILTSAIAYPLTGIFCIMYDFKKPYHDRPAYARNPSRYLKGFLMMIFIWPYFKVVIALKCRLWWEAGSTLLIFISLAVWGLITV